MTDNLLELIKSTDVEWKKLGGIGEVRMCKRILKNQTSSEGEIPFFKIGTFGRKENAYITYDLFEEYKKKYNYPKVGDILISASGTIGRTVKFDGEDAYFQDSNIVWIENDESQVLNDYLWHFYQIANWGISEGGTIQRLYNDNLRKVKVPVPPLDIQEKIVEVLDKMTKYVTELTAELTAELTLRHQQYTYYRDKLFSEDELAKVGFEWKTLGEVAELKRGKRLVKSELQEKGKYPVYQNSMKPLGYYNENNFCAETVFIISAGAAGEIGYSNCDFWAADDVYVLLTPDTLNSRFLYHFLLTRQYSILSKVRRASIPRLSRNVVESIVIPIPSLPEQERIVAILDKFDALTNCISEGIPKEIELRQKQYEYWREQLLSFDK